MPSGGLINIFDDTNGLSYLTAKPEITFFKKAYQRYTNFSMETSSLDFNDGLDFNEKNECVLSKQGDLVSNIYLKMFLFCIIDLHYFLLLFLDFFKVNPKIVSIITNCNVSCGKNEL